MRRVLAPLLLVLAATPAHAQPGPGDPITVQYARELAAEYTRASTSLEPPASLAQRLAARRDIALIVAKAHGRFAGFPEFVEVGANTELEHVLGFGFADAGKRLPEAWQACVAEARKAHGIDDVARECIRESRPYHLERYVIGAPDAFLHAASADASAAFYRGMHSAFEADTSRPELRHALAAMQLATTDYAAALDTLEPLSDGYDEAVSRAEAERGIRRIDAAERTLVSAIVSEPRRPEAHHALALLLYDQRYDEMASADLERKIGRAWHHMLAYLCLRTQAALPAPARAFEDAGDVAEDLDRRNGTGGSYWMHPSELPQPPPFLPNEVLPPRFQAPPDVKPARSCEDAVAAAMTAASASEGGTDGPFAPEPAVDAALPKPPPAGGCAACTVERPAAAAPEALLLFAACALALCSRRCAGR